MMTLIKRIGLFLLLAGSVLLVNAQESVHLTADSTPISKQSFPRFRIALSGGISLILSLEHNSSEWFDLNPANYEIRAITKPVVNGDVAYYFKPRSAIGLKYMRITDTYDKKGLRDVKTTNFIGPVFYQNFNKNSSKNRFALGGAIGYYQYYRKLTLAGVIQSERAGGLGGLLEIVYDIKIANNVYLGLNTGIVGAELSAYKLTMEYNPSPENKEIVDRKMDFFISGGIRLVR